ncbi:MAG TPA: TrkA family potassium uptake protein, partial [Anaerolineales bacterium]
MFVIIVGGGQTGSQLAIQLLHAGHKVKVIEDRPVILERLKAELPADIVIAGDGSSPSVLEKAGIEQANVLAAVTGEDESNLVITTLGRYEFNVPRTIARVNNPKNAWLFDKEMGVDVALNQADILAKLILEEMSLGDMMTLLKLRKGEFSIVEEKVHPTSPAANQRLADLTLPPECVFLAILRKGRMIIPHGDTVL